MELCEAKSYMSGLKRYLIKSKGLTIVNFLCKNVFLKERLVMTRTSLFCVILFIFEIVHIKSEWVTYDDFFEKLDMTQNVKQSNIIRANRNCGKNKIMIANGICRSIIVLG